MSQKDLYHVQIVSQDPILISLFNTHHEIHHHSLQSSGQPTTQDPSHYDQKDIERDYLSDCPPSRKPPKKSKKRKMITNRTVKIRRQRKNKLYIEMLENRIFELQREIEILRRTNNNNRQTIKKNNDSEQIVNGFFVNKQRHYEKLVALTKQKNIDEKRFIEEYNMLRIRQGAVGKDRIKVINYYFKQLSQIMLPDLQKYIMKTVQEETDLFDPNFIKNGALGSYMEQWRKEMIHDLQLSFEKITRITELKGGIIEEKRKMEHYFQQFYDSKCKIIQASRKMEMTYDRLNIILSPRQIAKCLCLIEKYKFEKGFSIEKIFYSTFSRLQDEQKQLYDPEHLYESV